MDMTMPLKPGTYRLEFVNGRTRIVTLTRTIVTASGLILYLEADDGRHYNWSTVISIMEA